eukprot:6187169-Pleurochrysis_carterae.AAC.6
MLLPAPTINLSATAPHTQLKRRLTTKRLPKWRLLTKACTVRARTNRGASTNGGLHQQLPLPAEASTNSCLQQPVFLQTSRGCARARLVELLSVDARALGKVGGLALGGGVVVGEPDDELGQQRAVDQPRDELVSLCREALVGHRRTQGTQIGHAAARRRVAKRERHRVHPRRDHLLEMCALLVEQVKAAARVNLQAVIPRQLRRLCARACSPIDLCTQMRIGTMKTAEILQPRKPL